MPTPQNSEYLAPFLRNQTIQEVMVSGYTTVRLSTGASLSPSGLDLEVLGLFENVSQTPFTIQLMQTADPSSSGLRSNVGSAIPLVPGGRVTTNFSPTQNYLEIWGTSGTGELRAQLTSKLQWNIMSFSKTDPFFPNAILVFVDNGQTFAQLGNTGS